MVKYLIAAFLLSLQAVASGPATHLRNGAINDDEQDRRSLSVGRFFNKVLGIRGGNDSVCPPEGFDALKEFDLESYISAPWYIQRQIPVAYQPVESLYCVRAEYFEDSSFCLSCNDKPRVIINNSANRGSVDGEQIGGDGGNRLFRGIVRDPENEPAKISVGYFADILTQRSTYWVVAAGTYDDLPLLDGETSNGNMYEWAIVTGGSPTKEGKDGKCLPDPGLLNFAGMWMFTRDATPSEEVVSAIDQYASKTLGLDTTAWLPVEQEGCVYPSS